MLVLLACAATPAPTPAAGLGAGATSTDSVSAPPRDASVPPATTLAASFTHRHSLGGALRPDRVTHTSLGLVIGAGVGLSSREPALGAGTVIALAVAKELLDDRFDREDLAAGAVGAGLAWLVVAALTR